MYSQSQKKRTKYTPIEVWAVPLTDEMVKQARMDESNIIEQKGGYLWDADGQWEEHNPEEDFIGSLAQQAVSWQFSEWGFAPEETPFFVATKTADEFDFRWRYENLDVKGSPTSPDYPKVYPRSRFLLPYHKREKHRGKVQRYIFVKVNYPDRVALIAGIIHFNDFWSKAQDCEEAGMAVKTPSAFVLTTDLASFRNFVFGVN